MDEPFDAICSIGMFANTSGKACGRLLDKVSELLSPPGRLLNHTINRSVATRRERNALNVVADHGLQRDGADASAMMVMRQRP